MVMDGCLNDTSVIRVHRLHTNEHLFILVEECYLTNEKSYMMSSVVLDGSFKTLVMFGLDGLTSNTFRCL